MHSTPSARIGVPEAQFAHATHFIWQSSMNICVRCASMRLKLWDSSNATKMFFRCGACILTKLRRVSNDS
ncbi:hypothetical protein D3C84_738880 [compost metagenome]